MIEPSVEIQKYPTQSNNIFSPQTIKKNTPVSYRIVIDVGKTLNKRKQQLYM